MSEREKILVIDDEEPTLKMFELFLQAYGYEPITATSGEQGLELFRSCRPSIVLTDIKMPGMDGLQVLKKIKEMNPRTEVIVITGHGDMDLAIRALNLDATDFINKPIGREDLEKALARARERIALSKAKQKEISFKIEDGKAIIKICGHVNALSASFLNDTFQNSLQNKVQKLIYVFEKSTTINGAGIAALSEIFAQARKKGLDIFVVNLPQNFQKVFQVLGLDKNVRLVDRLDQIFSPED
ncbi:response regulator [Desulfovulcanus sp.]